MVDVEKNNRIRESGKETRKRRENQDARVFEIKFDANKIMKEGLSLWNIGETLAEDNTSTSNMLNYIKSIPHVKASISVEARSPKQTEAAQAHFRKGGVVHFCITESLLRPVRLGGIDS